MACRLGFNPSWEQVARVKPWGTIYGLHLGNLRWHPAKSRLADVMAPPPQNPIPYLSPDLVKALSHRLRNLLNGADCDPSSNDDDDDDHDDLPLPFFPSGLFLSGFPPPFLPSLSSHWLSPLGVLPFDSDPTSSKRALS